MDYEKKYNEALEDMRAIYPNLKGDAKIAVEHSFPELKESEDERKSERVIKAARRVLNNWLYGDISADVSGDLTELEYSIREYDGEEKQKEHHIPWYDYQKSKEAGYTIVPNEEYEQLIKQKEEKPVEIKIDNPNIQKIDPDVKISTSDSSTGGDRLLYASWRDEKAEQKPNIELIQKSWYMEGYHDCEFGYEPKWIIKTGEGGPRYEENPKYGQHIEKQEQPEVDLEEAARQYVRSRPFAPDESEPESTRKAFIAGAEWQKEQMMKDAAEGEVCILPGRAAYVEEKDNESLKQYLLDHFKYGDKVKIIIVKEEEE